MARKDDVVHPPPVAPQDALSGPKPIFPAMALPPAPNADDRAPWDPQARDPAPWRALSGRRRGK